MCIVGMTTCDGASMGSVMHKFIRRLLLSGLFLATGVPFAAVKAESLVLENPEAYQKKERPAVTFPHGMHADMLDCLRCHHDYVDGRNLLDEDELEATDPAIRCASCHAGDATVDLKRAFHQQCIGCHHQERKAGLSTPPELCGECHSKRRPKP